MKIRTYLFMFGAAVLVPAFIAAGVGVHEVRKSQQNEAIGALRETVRSTSLMVDGEIQRSIGALTALGNSEHLATGNLAAFYEQAKAVNLPSSVWTLLLDDTGVQVLNTAVPFGTPPPPPGAKDRVQKVLAGQGVLISDLGKGPVTGRMLTTVYVAARVAAPGRRFVLAQAFDVEHWHRRLGDAAGGKPGWVLGVLDRQGRFVWRSHDGVARAGQPARPELVAAAAREREGVIRHHTPEGGEVYDAFGTSTLTGWTIAVAAPVRSVDAEVQRGMTWLIAATAVGLSSALAAALLLGRFLAKSIDATAQAAREVGRRRFFDVSRSPVDEINALNDSLQQSSRLLMEGQIALDAATAERERLYRNELAAKEEAQRQNLEKDRFLALLGHELRNPLSAINGANEVLTRLDIADPRSQRLLTIIRRQTANLRRIVDDLLDVSRLWTGKLQLSVRRIDLAGCVEQCVHALRASDTYTDRTLIVESQQVWVQGDTVRLEQIVSNLITNAMKFSPPGASVRVVVRPEGRHAMIKVVDQGAGIDADLLLRVFEPFVQGRPSEGDLPAGLGIGLALVKQLVELHDGEVQARSAGPGQGSTFIVLLPRCAESRAVTIDDEAQVPRGKRVLLVEDNPDACETTAGLLRALDLVVQTAATGQDGLRCATASPPDLVLLDIGLPDLSGYEVAARMRSTPGLADLPIVALTGYGQDSDKRAAREAGFTDHLTKPVDVNVLARMLARHLQPASAR